MFDPDLNPYVSEIENHRDIIVTDQFKDDSERKTVTQKEDDKPIIIDLGCGAGNFLRDYALTAPERSFYGFELRFKRLVKGAIKFKKHNIHNVTLIQARAESVRQWFHPNSVNEIYINFPDPWPKKRHHKHRLMGKSFLDTLKSLLVEGGFWSLKTDHRDYFQPVVELARNRRDVKIVEYSEDLHHSPFSESNILTEFEALFKNKGYPVYYLKCEFR